MIDYPDQEQDRLTDPGVPDDIKWLGGTIGDVTHWLKKVYDALRRQESPNPSVINLNPGRTYQTSTRMRSYALVFSGGTANNVIGLRVGSAIAWDWVVPASPGPFTIPMPIVFDAGVDIKVIDTTVPDTTNWRCRVLAYVELEDGND